jgi:hypothetical protein
MRLLYRLIIAGLAIAATPVSAQENYGSWEVLKNPFPSTGGGGFMIDGYKPVIRDGKCLTDFDAIAPDGTVYRNTVEFDAAAVQGGTLCTDGKWRALDGSATGTTPFRMFIKDGVVRRAPV